MVRSGVFWTEEVKSQDDPEWAEAKLYYTDQFWASLGLGDPPVSVNTYATHVWNVSVLDSGLGLPFSLRCLTLLCFSFFMCIYDCITFLSSFDIIDYG